MKQIFAVNVDSFSNVITNSSTDIFACKTDKSVQAVEDLLNSIASAAGESAGCKVAESTIRDFFEIVKWYAGYDMDGNIDRYLDLDDKKISDELYTLWLTKHAYFFGSDADEKNKIIIIEGNDDNSIPYWLQEFIENRLGGLRYHLG